MKYTVKKLKKMLFDECFVGNIADWSITERATGAFEVKIRFDENVSISHLFIQIDPIGEIIISDGIIVWPWCRTFDEYADYVGPLVYKEGDMYMCLSSELHNRIDYDATDSIFM